MAAPPAVVGELYACSLACQIRIIGAALGENMQLGSQTFVQCLVAVASVGLLCNVSWANGQAGR